MVDFEIILGRIDDLAEDLGRLRKRVAGDELGTWQVDRCAHVVESLACMFEPTAHDISAHHAPGDHHAAAEALRIVDGRSRRLRVKLGLEKAEAAA